MQGYKKTTKDELVDICRENGIRNYSNKTKSEIVELIKRYESEKEREKLLIKKNIDSTLEDLAKEITQIQCNIEEIRMYHVSFGSVKEKLSSLISQKNRFSQEQKEELLFQSKNIIYSIGDFKIRNFKFIPSDIDVLLTQIYSKIDQLMPEKNEKNEREEIMRKYEEKIKELKERHYEKVNNPKYYIPSKLFCPNCESQIKWKDLKCSNCKTNLIFDDN